MNPIAPNQPDPLAPAIPTPGSVSGAPVQASQLPATNAFDTYNAGPSMLAQDPNVAPQTLNGQVANPVVAPATSRANLNSTQNTLLISEIRDGIVIMNDGSFRAVVMVKSINFDLMSPQEQEAVEFSYQGFLNSLYFPIQIFIRTQRVDLEPYIARLDKIRTEHDNMLMVMLMEDYINYISDLSQQTNIMDKRFYIVVPFFPTIDVQKALTQSKNFLSGLKTIFIPKEHRVTVNEAELRKAKDELRNRVQSVLSGLSQSGIQGLPLDTQELIELYYDTYNPDTATRQQLRNFDDLSADVVTKGEGVAPQSHLQGELK